MKKSELNKVNNNEEFNNKKSILDSYPQRLYVELTGNCNMNCKMCFQSKETSNDKTMSFSLFKKIADELFPYSNFIDLRGFGESTILPNFIDYAKYANKFDSKTGIVTNLSVKNNNLWTYLIKNKFWIGISIDGFNRETYGEIRNKKYFTQVIRNIMLLVNLRKKYKTKNKLYFIVVIQQDNMHNLEEFVKLANKTGIKEIEFKPVKTWNEKISIVNKTSIVKKSLKRAFKLAKKKNIKTRLINSIGDEKFENDLGLSTSKDCSRPWSHLYIKYNGEVGPCNHRPNLLLGNLKKDNFRKIWNNDSFVEFREEMLSTPKDFECKKCFNNYFNNDFS